MVEPKKGKWIYSRDPYDGDLRVTCEFCGFFLEGDNLPSKSKKEVQSFSDGFGTREQTVIRVVYEPPCQCPSCGAELERKQKI